MFRFVKLCCGSLVRSFRAYGSPHLENLAATHLSSISPGRHRRDGFLLGSDDHVSRALLLLLLLRQGHDRRRIHRLLPQRICASARDSWFNSQAALLTSARGIAPFSKRMRSWQQTGQLPGLFVREGWPDNSLPSTHPVIAEPCLFCLGGIHSVLGVNQQVSAHSRLELLQVQSPKLIPLRRGYKGVGAFGSFVRIRTILHRMAVKYAGAGRHRDRIIHLQSTALRAQGFADPDRTRLADIVRVRFEGEAQDADGLVGEASKALPNLVDDPEILAFIYFHCRLDRPDVHAKLPGCRAKGPGVLGKAVPSETRPGVEEFGAA